MKMAASSFLRSVKLITNRGLRDDTFVKEFSAMLTREKETFRRDVARFHGDEDSCPNKCGDSGLWELVFYPSSLPRVLLRLLRWCDSCLLHTYPCRKSTDCGGRQINVHEKEDLVLNCELRWHIIATGGFHYSFYRISGRNSETLVYKGNWLTLTKPLVRPEDEGMLFPSPLPVLTQRIIAETTSKSSTFVTQPSTIGTQSPAIGTEAEEEIWDDLSPTLVPSERSNPEDMQTCLLIGAAALVLFTADHRIFHWRTLLSVWDGDRFHKVQIPHRQGSCSTGPASTELAVTEPAVT